MTHLGRLPLPDQVSTGSAGFRYLGTTFGCGRCCALDATVLAEGCYGAGQDAAQALAFLELFFA